MVRNEGERLKRVIVCTPRQEYARASNLEKHNIGDLGEFAKGMGGPNCLIMPVERGA